MRSLTPSGLMNVLDLHESQRYALCLEPLAPSPFRGHITFSQVIITFCRFRVPFLVLKYFERFSFGWSIVILASYEVLCALKVLGLS